MRALVLSKDPAERVVAATVEEPEAAPDQAVVAVEAFSPNRGELMVLKPGRPRPGKDVAGTVVTAAADGSGPPAGTRVVAHLEWGGWAERAAVPAASLAVLPDDVATTDAAALPLAGLTALRMLRTLGSVSSRRILLTGASGGVGHYFVELAAAQGASVTAVSRRGERLRELGAAEAVASVTDAEGPFEIGIDSVGGTSTGEVLRRLTEDGQLLWMGQASGEPAVLDMLDWSGGSGATIHRFAYFLSSVPDADDLATLVRLVAAGHLHPEVGVVTDWAETSRVLADLQERRVRGNAVLTVA